jgi:hypothetical protein
MTIVRAGQVQPDAAGLQADQEQVALSGLKGVYQPSALFGGGRAVQP